MISFSLAPFTGLSLLSNIHTVVVESIGYLIRVIWAKEFISSSPGTRSPSCCSPWAW